MLRLNTPALTDALNKLGLWRARLNKQLVRIPEFEPHHVVPLGILSSLIKDAKIVRRAARQVGALVTCATIDDFITAMKKPGVSTYAIVDTWVIAIHSTMRREIGLFRAYFVPSTHSHYVEPPTPLFGKEVAVKFPSAAFDIDEAGKCLGLSRPTASVFHLMRVLELTLTAIGSCLSLPDPLRDSDRNWGKMLQRIQAEVKSRMDGTGAKFKGVADKKFFADFIVSLDAVRVAWRNPTMHVESRYTMEEAEHIFSAVKGLTRLVAERTDELGMPQA